MILVQKEHDLTPALADSKKRCLRVLEQMGAVKEYESLSDLSVFLVSRNERYRDRIKGWVGFRNVMIFSRSTEIVSYTRSLVAPDEVLRAFHSPDCWRTLEQKFQNDQRTQGVLNAVSKRLDSHRRV